MQTINGKVSESVQPMGSITYRVVHNALAARCGKAKCNTVSVIHTHSWRREALARELVRRNTGLSLGQTIAVLIELESLGADLMARGDLINLGFVRCFATITGLIGNDGVLSDANKIVVRAVTTMRFRTVAARATLVNVTPTPPRIPPPWFRLGRGFPYGTPPLAPRSPSLRMDAKLKTLNPREPVSTEFLKNQNRATVLSEVAPVGADDGWSMAHPWVAVNPVVKRFPREYASYGWRKSSMVHDNWPQLCLCDDIRTADDRYTSCHNAPTSSQGYMNLSWAIGPRWRRDALASQISHLAEYWLFTSSRTPANPTRQRTHSARGPPDAKYRGVYLPKTCLVLQPNNPMCLQNHYRTI